MLHFIVVLLIKQTDRWTDKHQQKNRKNSNSKARGKHCTWVHVSQRWFWILNETYWKGKDIFTWKVHWKNVLYYNLDQIFRPIWTSSFFKLCVCVCVCVCASCFLHFMLCLVKDRLLSLFWDNNYANSDFSFYFFNYFFPQKEELSSVMSELQVESLLEVHGTVRARPDGQQNEVWSIKQSGPFLFKGQTHQNLCHCLLQTAGNVANCIIT